MDNIVKSKILPEAKSWLKTEIFPEWHNLTVVYSSFASAAMTGVQAGGKSELWRNIPSRLK
jgi:hypothetical protein